MEIMVNYFKYKIRTGIKGVQNDIKKLKNFKMDGVEVLDDSNDYIWFSISNKLYRRLKLIKLSDEYLDKNLKFLDFIISISEKITEDDLPYNWSYGEWASGEYYFETKEEARRYQEETKSRIRYHNNMYKQKMKK